MYQQTVRIYDTPVLSLPDDLYIPPHAFAIWLEQFAGPLDFLLYLVKKNNFDLTETAILPITEQYLAYISGLDSEYFELAGDYLLMASTLIAIKSELLLPQSKPEEDKESNPTKRLIQRLEEYAQIKEASKRLDALVRLEKDVFLAYASLPDPKVMMQNQPKFSPELLASSLIQMQNKPDYQMHHIKSDPVLLSERITKISQALSKQGRAHFFELIDKAQGKIGVVVSFVAILELMKRGLVGFVAGEDFKSHQAPPSLQDTDVLINEQILCWLH